MKAVLALFDIVPGWAWAIALVAALAHGFVTVQERDSARSTISQMNEKVATDRAERERVARIDAEQVARVQFRHAEIQQENTNAAIQREAARAARERALAADNQRLRDDILAASRRGDESEPDAAACRRDRDLARQLGADLAEAVGLQEEAEATIRKRDDEVTRLLEVIHNDRAAVGGQ